VASRFRGSPQRATVKNDAGHHSRGGVRRLQSRILTPLVRREHRRCIVGLWGEWRRGLLLLSESADNKNFHDF
jgi:hypothetical protein